MQERQYKHVYRMVDTEGNMTTSCDCRDSVGPNCLHCLVIERHHTEFEEPVLEGEEPNAFLIYNRRHELLYLFSVATASGSARHHSHKRTIVTCDISDKWSCKSCSRSQYKSFKCHFPNCRDCRHIQAAQKNLESLGFEANTTIKEASALFTRAHSNPVVRRCVSHLPIQTPAWCRLPSDTVINNVPVDSLQHLPSVLQLDATTRCSCGNDDIDDEVQMTTDSFTLYTSTTAVQLRVETVYCRACSNTHGTIGPDLGQYGILNWNNKIGFSHQLLNAYTLQLTYSETPFNAYYRLIQGEYLSSQSPVAFCDDEIFEYAWFAFIRLQEIESTMECSRCGPNPKVVIADGISVSFPSHHRTESLRPPTVPNKEHAWVRLRKSATKNTCFIGPNKIRKSIYQALNISDCTIRLEMLQKTIENLKEISVPSSQIQLTVTRNKPKTTLRTLTVLQDTMRWKRLEVRMIIPAVTDNSFCKFSPVIVYYNWFQIRLYPSSSNIQMENLQLNG